MLFLYLLHERTQVLKSFQPYHVTQRLVDVVHNGVGNKTKSIRPRPSLGHRGRSETGLVIQPRSPTARLIYFTFNKRLSATHQSSGCYTQMNVMLSGLVLVSM